MSNNYIKGPQPRTMYSWPTAYKAFLLDRHESIILKIAPLVMLLGAPEIIASNLLPVVGEFEDVGAIALTVVVVFRTLMAVRRHR